jgi:hypothetical protein
MTGSSMNFTTLQTKFHRIGARLRAGDLGIQTFEKGVAILNVVKDDDGQESSTSPSTARTHPKSRPSTCSPATGTCTRNGEGDKRMFLCGQQPQGIGRGSLGHFSSY